MELIADTLMVAGSFGAAIYCYVLSHRLKRFTTLETGMGGAIAVLSAQVDDMTRALEGARGAANGSASSLETLTLRGEAVAKRLELLVAALHDLPESASDAAPDAAPGAATGAVSGGSVAAQLGRRAGDTAREPPAPDDDRRLRFVRRRATREPLQAAE